jgi:hypothetical protein
MSSSIGIFVIFAAKSNFDSAGAAGFGAGCAGVGAAGFAAAGVGALAGGGVTGACVCVATGAAIGGFVGGMLPSSNFLSFVFST